MFVYFVPVFVGTSDEHISIIEVLKDYEPDGAILVTTPQVSIVILNYFYTIQAHFENSKNMTVLEL